MSQQTVRSHYSSNSDAAGAQRDRRVFAFLFGGIFLTVSAFVLLFELSPAQNPTPRVPFTENGTLRHRDVVLGMLWLSCIGAAGIITWGFTRRWPWAQTVQMRKAVKAVLIAAVFLSGFNYFYSRRGLELDHYAHRHDTFHYFMHPRYYAELDYADLYTCAVEAISPDILPDNARVRDLRTYRMTTAGDIRTQNLCVPSEKFTPESWDRWQRDLKVYTDTKRGSRILGHALQDLGYNGTPFHSSVSGFLADKVPFSIATHNTLPLLDVAMICVMLYAVAAAFGWQIGLVFALAFFVSPADRFGIIGGSWFRYAWLVTLVLGVVALKRGRYGWSGIWMALSALLNVFPVLFSAGILIRGAVECWKQKRLVRKYRNFVLAGLVTGMVGLGIGLLPARHIDNYTGWVSNMAQHNSERFQGFGVGLKFPFIYRGANLPELDRGYKISRQELFHQNRKAFNALAIVVLVLAFSFAARTDDDVEAASILGFTLFFTLLGTVGYYFVCASLLVLALHRRSGSPGGTILLSLWFVTLALANWALYETMFRRFMYNTVISLSWTVWLVALLFWLAAREGLLDKFAQWLAAPSRTRK